MVKFQALVINQTCLGEEFFHLKLSTPVVQSSPALPGQFIHIYCRESGTDPLLPRPLSLFRIYPRTTAADSEVGAREIWEVLYKKVGKGTAWLSRRKANDALEVLGPLGRGFSLPQETAGKPGRILLIAGGIGMPPLFALGEELSKRGREVILFYGGRSKQDLLFLQEWRDLASQVYLVTEDGSIGRSGLVTDLLREKVQPQSADFYYACGPRPMLQAVQDLMNRLAIPGELSLEERMACGVGACLGCVTRTTHGYKRVCREGPVFPADEVILDE
ncbi:MAG TPA: dihydroorotate dehydrogenase electron transfer subunit [Firmicutes bacterium]|jgi:dihydroorotate dehydrogenase electron transfer subunit|nr:dihydroorotate dehydrogenase electron transfer subunit [Bacillota bacterium]